MAKRKPIRMEKKDKKLIDFKMGLVLFIGILMVGSIAGIVWQGDNAGVKYNGIKFRELQYGYAAKINNKDYTFRYLPEDLIRMEFDQTLISSIRQQPGVIIVFNPNDENIDTLEQFRYETETLLTQSLGKQVRAAVTEESSTYQYPVINCTNTSIDTSYGVTYLKVQRVRETGMTMEGACFVMSFGSLSDLAAYRDRLFYELLGVYDKK